MSFDGRVESKRSNPAGTPCADAGATGATDISASRATEPKRTVLVREFWRNFDMMISFSRLTRRSRLWHLEDNNTVTLHIKVTSQLIFGTD
jgi:hypothetical protein